MRCAAVFIRRLSLQKKRDLEFNLFPLNITFKQLQDNLSSIKSVA